MNICKQYQVGIYVLAALFFATPAFAVTQTHTCKSTEVAVFAERIHVRCNTPATVSTSTGIIFFALSTSNSVHVARILSLLTSAHIAQKTIWITFDPNEVSAATFGCLVNDCRRILSVGMN